MTASADLELSQTDCASEATHHRTSEQTVASQSALNKHQVAEFARTEHDDHDDDQDQASVEETRRGAAKESAWSSATRAESCCSATTKPAEQSRLEPEADSCDKCDSERDGEPRSRPTAQARGGPPRHGRASGDSRATTVHQYSQFLYEHQPQHQPILPMSFQPYQVANPQHLLNYLEQQQQQQQMLQPPAASQPGFYHQPLVSWACAPPDAGPIREPHQLYAPAALLLQHHHQPAVCALPPNYNQHHQLQPAPVVPGNFGPLGLPIANYLPAPAFYTGQPNPHHYHHPLYGQPQQQQQVVAPPSPPPPHKPDGLGQVQDRAYGSPSPSASSSSSDSDAADTSRVIVDGDVAASHSVGKELGERAGEAAPPQGANGKAAAERGERAAVALDDETTSAQSNRQSTCCQQRPTAATSITTSKPTPASNLMIRRDDIGGSKNGTRREQRKPLEQHKQRHESESLNGVGADETRQEEQKKAAAPLGGEDHLHAGARVKPFDGEVPSAQAYKQANIRSTADCETSPTGSRHQQVASTSVTTSSSAVAAAARQTKTIDEAQGADALMVATIGDRAPTQLKTTTEEPGRSCQLAGHLDSRITTPDNNNNNQKQEPARTRQTLQQDGSPAMPLAHTGPISINGTTFYHVNPALVRVGMPPPQTAAHEQPVCMYQATNKNLMSYLAPGQPYHKLASDYTHNQMLTLPPNRIAADYFYYWPPPAATNSRRFDLVQTTGLASSNQQHHLLGSPPYELDQRPFVALHHHLAYPRPFQFDPYYNCITQQPPFVPPQPHQMSQAASHTPLVAPPPPQPPAAALLGQPQASNPTVAATSSGAAPVQTSSASNGVSQLKLGYNLIPLLPIGAIPTRVRQAYGMDKVWQDEFEQLFSQFVSQVVWTLVEVETNPNIRSSCRLLAYKGRYIVRVENPAVASSRSDGSCSVASTANQDDKQPEPACDEEDDTGSWAEGHEDADTCCCSTDDSDGNHRDGDNRQGRSAASNSCESDCDSGAALNSTSGSSETTSQDSNELNSSQSPASSSPCHMATSLLNQKTPAAAATASSRQANRDEQQGGSKTQTERKFPLKFRMFIDSAKVRFCCDSCGHGWTSMKGRVVFWYELFELIDGTGTADGVSNLIGYCAYKLFGQQCDICKIENRFERPMWYPEEVTKVLCNFFNKIGQVYFGFRMPAIDKQRRAGKPKTSHNSLLCQACHDGVCTDRK